MKKYRKKPIVIEAVQWFHEGDHPEVVYCTYGGEPCENCENPSDYHGWIKTLEGGHFVCPGDWIIKGIEGEFYPCKPSIFEATYEEVSDD